MASPQYADTQAEQEAQLKYLEFFRIAVVRATSYATTIYEYAKDSSGPLKPGVDSVEGTVKTVVGPVIQQFQNKPAEFLQFLDSKVDVTITLLDGVVPEFVKEKSQQALGVARLAPDAAKVVYSNVREQGLYGTARAYYDKYEPVAEELANTAWRKLQTHPLVPQVLNAVAPSALYGADKVNNLVLAIKERHLPFSYYVPLLPMEKLEKALRPESEQP